MRGASLTLVLLKQRLARVLLVPLVSVVSLVQAPGPLLSTSLRSACENPLREHKAGQVEFICVAAAWGEGGVNSHSWGRRGIPSFYFLLGIKMNADKLGCHLLSGVTLHAFKSVCLIEHTQQPPPTPTLPTPPQLPHPGRLAHQNGRKMYSNFQFLPSAKSSPSKRPPPPFPAPKCRRVRARTFPRGANYR